MASYKMVDGIVTDFSPDKLEFTMSADDFRVTAADDGHAVIRYGDDVVNLLGVTPRQLSHANFMPPSGSDTAQQTCSGSSGSEGGSTETLATLPQLGEVRQSSRLAREAAL
jgi:hypothetical protein